MSPSSKMLRTEAAAEMVGVKPATLKALRLQGGGPIYHRLSYRLVVYDPADLIAWLQTKRRLSTSTAA